MSALRPFDLKAPDGKSIHGDRAEGRHRQILFMTGFLSKRWGNKSKALAQWCQDQGWGFCCYDVRGFGDSEGSFTDYTLSDWVVDARLVLDMVKEGPPITVVGNSLGSWIAWMMAQECERIERLVLLAPAFNMMGVRARSVSEERRHAWLTAGWMPWDDDELHRKFPIAWKWVEESEAYWRTSFDAVRRVRTTIVHGLEDTVILPQGSTQFVELLLARDPAYPVDLQLIPGDHRLSTPEHLERFHRIMVEYP